MALFGTDGIRGIPNRYPLDHRTVALLGRAIGTLFKRENCENKVCIARDTRHSGTFLAAAVTAGILSEGCDVLDLGVLPTPGCAVLTRTSGAIAGVVISASHNPATDNGIKIFDSSGAKLPQATEKELERYIEKEAARSSDKSSGRSSPPQPGRVIAVQDSTGGYLSLLQEHIPGLSLEGMKIVVDCSNGATENAAPKLFHKLKADVDVINNHSDGFNINRDCGSEHLEGACRRVRETGADMGIVFDGDGDRVILIDEKGDPVDGDHIMALLAVDLQETGALPGNAIVCTDYSNKGLDLCLKKYDIQVVRGGVGDRDVFALMKKRHYILGGEQSGHIIQSQCADTGDGILTALLFLKLYAKKCTPVSGLASIMKTLPQTMINIEVPARPPLAKLPETSHTIEKVEHTLADKGRVYVRYSGTQNLLRVMVEGENKEEIEDLAKTIAEAAEKEIEELVQSGVAP